MDLTKALAELRQEHKALSDAIAILEGLGRIRNAEAEPKESDFRPPAPKRRARPRGRKHSAQSASQEE